MSKNGGSAHDLGQMTPLVIASQTLAFTLEMALVAAFGVAGYRLGGGGIAGWAMVAAGAALVILPWAILAAPKSPRRLRMPWILAFKLAIFAAGAIVLWLSDEGTPALIFGGFATLHLGLASRLGAV